MSDDSAKPEAAEDIKLVSQLVVHVVDGLPVGKMMTMVANGTLGPDRLVVVAYESIEDTAIYVEVTGQPTRAVFLYDLIDSILNAKGIHP